MRQCIARQMRLCWGDSLCTRVLNSTCLRLKSDLRLCGVRPTFEQVSASALANGCHGVYLRYGGMHASIVVRVVVMGRCARGTFGSREGDGVALRVASKGISSCVGASRGFDCGWNGHGLAMGRALAIGQPKPTRTHTHASPDP